MKFCCLLLFERGVGDVRSALKTIESDLVGFAVGKFTSFVEGGSLSDDGKDASSVGNVALAA